MTYEEAVDYPAGRDLDVLIAEKVFGYRIVSREWPCDTFYLPNPSPYLQSIDDPDKPYEPDSFDGSEIEPDALEPVFDVGGDGYRGICIVPHYSTQDGPAVDIIRRMCELGWHWCVHDTDQYADEETAKRLPFYCYFARPTADGGHAEPEAGGDTFALSVARAALSAFCEITYDIGGRMMCLVSHQNGVIVEVYSRAKYGLAPQYMVEFDGIPGITPRNHDEIVLISKTESNL